MLIAIRHDIHDASKFQERAEQVFPLPHELRVLQFFPASDMSSAACLYEAPSVDHLSNYIDRALGNSSTQSYFAVNEEHAIGLPDAKASQEEA